MLKKMKDDKNSFLKHHAVKSNVNDKSISSALKGMGSIPSVISIPVGKREAEDDVESLEEKQRFGKTSKKAKRS